MLLQYRTNRGGLRGFPGKCRDVVVDQVVEHLVGRGPVWRLAGLAVSRQSKEGWDKHAVLTLFHEPLLCSRKVWNSCIGGTQRCKVPVFFSLRLRAFWALMFLGGCDGQQTVNSLHYATGQKTSFTNKLPNRSHTNVHKACNCLVGKLGHHKIILNR